MEREARYHEYVVLQPFTSIDTLDTKFRGGILRRLGSRGLISKLPGVGACKCVLEPCV